MTIELKPEQERILQEALRQGRFQSQWKRPWIGRSNQSPRRKSRPGRTTRPPGKKSLAQLFAESPFKGLEMKFERFPDTLPPVEL